MILCQKSGGDDNNGQLITARQKPHCGSVPACQSWRTGDNNVAEEILSVNNLQREVHVSMGAPPLRCRLEGADMSYTGFIQKPV